MTDQHCQKRLAMVWVAGGMAVLLLLAVQAMRDVFGENSERAFAWFAATVLPTLTVIVGTVMSQAYSRTPPSTVQPFPYHLSLGLSVFYLVLVLASLMYAATSTSHTPLESLTRSLQYLGPVQVLVGLAVGAFFGSRGSEERLAK
jgi:hypothetical protein